MHVQGKAKEEEFYIVLQRQFYMGGIIRGSNSTLNRFYNKVILEGRNFTRKKFYVVKILQ